MDNYGGNLSPVDWADEDLIEEASRKQSEEPDNGTGEEPEPDLPF